MGRRLASLVVVAALAVTAGFGFQRVFDWHDLLGVLAVGGVAPVLVSVAASGVWRARDDGARRAGPLWISIVLSAVVWLLVVAGTLFGDRLAEGVGPLLRSIGTGLANSWKSTLTTILPAPPRPELLIGVHVVVWLAAFIGAELALRTRSPALPALPAVGAFGVTLLLGVDGPGSNLPVSGTLVALAVVLILVRSPTQLRWLAAGVPIAVVLALVAVVAGPQLPVSGEPYDPRQSVQAPPPHQRDSVSPLDRVSAWLQSPGQKLFTVRSDTPENWRLAVLDRFDGATWSSDTRFVPSGSRVPRGPFDDDDKRDVVRQRITIGQLPGVWLPAANRPRSVTGMRMSVAPDSGVLTGAKQLHPGMTYQVTSATREYDPDELTGAVPAQDAAAKAATRLPTGQGGRQVPQLTRFQKIAQRAIAGANSPFQQAAKLSDYLRSHGVYDVTAPPGHTYRNLEYFLATTHRGTSEQFATSYAVLARTLGLPTRVVVGFRPGVKHGDTWQVHGGDVLVWPEVKFSGVGWVPFFPTPQHKERSKQSQSVPVGKTQQKLEHQQKNAASKRNGQGHGKRHHTPPPDPPSDQHQQQPGSLPWWVYAIGAAVLVVLGYLMATLLVPALRRRRRRRGPDVGTRISGAWQQTVDHLRDAGLPSTRTMTAHEVERFGVETVGDDAHTHLRPLADLLNRVRYSGAPPPGDAAEDAWQHSDAVGRLVTQSTGRFRRIRRRLHPRSLRGPTP